MSEDKSKDAAKDELHDFAISLVAQVLSSLANRYGDHFDDAYELNREFVKVMSLFLGEIIGHYGDDDRDDLFDQTVIYMKQIMLETSSDIANADKEHDEEIQSMVDKIMGHSLPNDSKGSC